MRVQMNRYLEVAIFRGFWVRHHHGIRTSYAVNWIDSDSILAKISLNGSALWHANANAARETATHGFNGDAQMLK